MAREAKRQTITNETARDRYRKIVASDQRGQTGVRPGAGEVELMMTVMGAWGGRYSRRRYVLEGVSGYADPLTDAIAAELIMERWRRRDAAYSAVPEWDPEMLPIMETGMKQLSRVGIADPHPCGPSLRALWAQGKGAAASDDAGWSWIMAWAHGATQERVAGAAGKAPVLKPGQGELLRRIDWNRTEDLDEPWAAEVDGAAWRVRLNDFPDEIAYSLVIDGKVIGHFQDWPQAWSRPGQAAVEPAPPKAPAVFAVAERWPARYEAGEHEQVWAEMVSLGPDVRNGAHLAPARAVAEATMRRARRNVEVLIPRLRAMGYRFYTPSPPPMDLNFAVGRGGPAGVSSLDDILKEAKAGKAPGMGPLAAMLGGLAGALGKMQAAQAERSAAASPSQPFHPADKDAAAHLARLARRGVVLPLSLEAWMTHVGLVDFTGDHPALCFMGADRLATVEADPLSIIPTPDDLDEVFEDWRKGEDQVELFVSFLPGDKARLGTHNDMIEDGYEMMLPEAAADAALEGAAQDRTFVQYLRVSFRHGGFPGWEGRPDQPAELKPLTEGLEPL
jgi:hypothetical protein